jgi:hypothetical protein
MKTDHVVGLCLTFRNILTHVDQMFSERARVTLWSGSAQSKNIDWGARGYILYFPRSHRISVTILAERQTLSDIAALHMRDYECLWEEMDGEMSSNG